MSQPHGTGIPLKKGVFVVLASLINSFYFSFRDGNKSKFLLRRVFQVINLKNMLQFLSIFAHDPILSNWVFEYRHHICGFHVVVPI